MKNIITLSVLTIASITAIFSATQSFNINETQDGKVILSFQLEEKEMKSESGYTRLAGTNEGRTMEEGKPELPLYSTFFQMEPMVTYSVSYEVISSRVLENIDLFPVQEVNHDWQTGDPIVKDNIYYNSGKVYPETNIIMSEPMIMRNLELAQLTFIPYKYHPDTRSLEIFDDVEIIIEESGFREMTIANQMAPSRTFEDLYETMIVNYQRTEDEALYQQPAVLYICGGGTGGAINHPAFLQLADWRHKRGYVVYTASTDETGGSSGSIKNYIEDAYETFDPPPEFVGLVGDVGGGYNIPTYQESWSGYGGDGDHPYSQLDGGDLLPEVLIGRISVSNGTDLSNVVNKTLSYEQAYDMTDWYERSALAGDTSPSGLSIQITNQYIQNILENFGVDEVNTIFGGGGGFPSWMQSQLANGILYFNYRGWLGVSGFGTSNINNANNGYKLPFVTFITCGTGSFGGTSISESFLRAGTVSNPKGGVAAIGTATSGTHTAFNNIVDMGIYDGIFSKDLKTAGAALANGKLALYQTYPANPSNKVSIFTHWNNLMGDPALHLWTDTPMAIDAVYSENIGIGTNFIDVSVTGDDGNPVENAWVTLVSDDDEIFVTYLTDEWGNVSIAIDDLTYSGTVDLTITKRNYIPHEGEFEIDNDGPIANIDNENIVVGDDSGNGNGDFNPGETILLQLPIHNLGTDNLVGLQAHLEVESVKIELLNGDVDLGSLDVGNIVIAEFELSGDLSLMHLEELGLIISINDSSLNQWFSYVHLNVHAPLINLVGYDVQGANMITPGMTREVEVDISNSGDLTAANLFIEVTSNIGLIEITDGYLEFGDLSPGEYGSSSTTMLVTASDDIVSGSIYNMEVRIQSSDGYDSVEFLKLQVGEADVNDPMGPDAHGYYIYDSGDLGYSLAPVYDWEEIDPGYGGDGTSLGMNDNGNGEPISSGTWTTVVDLPFTFSFYGIDYDEISVCSNGWISFGESDLASFRNYPIPGAGGPSPMVAVFWDDMKTGNDGDVYYYFNEVEELFIIEWSDMHTYDQNSNESFQIILFNGLTPTGDGEMIINYKDFNNTSIGSYGGYTPIHGAYSTIGIENELGSIGLQYTFNNEYPLTSMPLSDETAIFITTRQPAAMLMGDTNQDGEINVLDILDIIAFILNSGTIEPIGQFVSDLDDNGDLNILDVILMINIILEA
ncbi:MAG: hypothetical protein HN729_10505 [Candidatus Marinimicrobia bacterium]|nr:hypothetical protein [Candidatus Neomarinimicrobiota bacterium]MBT3634081.1 hypothetical protein [Candidatus Neomarinimicrobiota bacterium]MBT3683045.1 hypothetical protein [Candidatus Neomarinimicrobiota bacterium]MBT3759863.1 hypothetical protein [Candidatus Neomarinimicrobiota bacterium]MBT3895684.1 hypothetical protein [Candidatus Neomarinimicrobiota bacterium]